MADINYIPKTHEGYTFEPDYKQVFHNKWTLNIGHDELVKMRNNGFITDSDMKIVKFLFKYRFATAEMMFRYMGDESKIENMEARLDKLVKFRILNKFMLSKVDAGTIVLTRCRFIVLILAEGLCYLIIQTKILQTG